MIKLEHIECPFCRHVHEGEDLWYGKNKIERTEDAESEFICSDCGKKFLITTVVHYEFISYAMEDDKVECFPELGYEFNFQDKRLKFVNGCCGDCYLFKEKDCEYWKENELLPHCESGTCFKEV
ncbi:MAG: hypothetical protein ACRC1T_09420 [Clostridium chrysemydis]|uniref:hypothetical protein n=1 Tax=Clostridium chrysemydis TaxID=2665504 RepID=UPI003F3AB658